MLVLVHFVTEHIVHLFELIVDHGLHDDDYPFANIVGYFAGCGLSDGVLKTLILVSVV